MVCASLFSPPVYSRVCRYVGLILVVGALAGCGGGSGGGSNSGQAPDPVVVDLPVAYVQRPIPQDDNGNPVFPDVFQPDEFNPGGELYLKDRATAQAAVTNVTRAAFIEHPFFDVESPNYDVKDVSVHPAGDRLLFAMRAPLDPGMDEDDERQPTWNIWEYNIKNLLLRRIITADFEAEKGHDVAPHYLPDGRILFTSNRQKRSKEILLDEGKPQFGAVTTQDGNEISFLLHTVKDDGTDIQQLTYNQSHDIQPTLLADGRLLFMRWQGNNPDRLSFYTSNPDGTDIQRYFGYVSLNAAPAEGLAEAPRLFKPQVLPDNRIAAIYMQNGLQLGGDMVVIDGRESAEGGVDSISIKPVDISADRVSLHGRFASLSPLNDGTNRLLVSWSQCRLLETATARLQPCLPTLLVDGVPIDGYEEAPPFYGIWIYDTNSQTQLPVVLAEDGKLFTEAVALSVNSNAPAYIAPHTDATLALENVGLLHIRSVYDLDGAFNPMGSGAANLAALAAQPADQRPARFIRITKAVSVASNDVLNDQDDNIYGNLFNNNTGIREIIGYTPVEPDGSVIVKVPSDVAFGVEILDANGRQIGAEHATTLQVRPGETMVCNGCHAPNNSNPHGRRDLEASPILAQSVSTAIAALSVDLDNTSSYDNLPYPTPDDIIAPTTPACRANWNSQCRIVINYEYHIQPLWELERNEMTVNDPELGMDVKANTCVACHSATSMDGNAQVPKAQLELARTKANNNSRMLSYMQLLEGNQRLAFWYNGMAERQIPACEYEDLNPDEFIPQCNVELDSNGVPTCEGIANCPFVVLNELTGELELDPATGNPVPRLVNTRFLPPLINRGGANSNAEFFGKFENNGSHSGFLNAAELKLLSEWLDTDGRYYTNPFEMAIQN